MDKGTLGRRGLLSGGLATALAAAPGVGGGEGNAYAISDHKEQDAAQDDADGPLFLAAFSDWLCTESERLAMPALIETTMPSRIDLRVQGVHPAICIPLHGYCEINVGVVWEEEYWDALLWLDADATPGPGGVGWIDIALLPEFQIVHPTREALWRVNVFEPLLTWINEDLAHATHLAMWGMPDGATWARLIRDGKVLRRGWTLEENGGTPAHLVPVHGHSV